MAGDRSTAISRVHDEVDVVRGGDRRLEAVGRGGRAAGMRFRSENQIPNFVWKFQF